MSDERCSHSVATPTSLEVRQDLEEEEVGRLLELQRGRAAATWLRLYSARHQVLDYLRRRVPAEELEGRCQDTLQLAHRKLWRFDPGRDPTRWMLHLAACVVRDWRRKHARTLAAADGGLEASRASADPAPLDQLVAVEQRSLLRRALRDLPPGTRRLLWDHHILGRSLRDLAEERGEAVNIVNCKLKRTRRLLRDRLVRRGLDGG